jgi:hypothetical protein
MKERPIIFSGDMIRAILEGRKTQTRRVCKQQPYGNGFAFEGNEFLCHNDYLPPSAMLMDVYKGGKYLYATSNMEGWESECPYGQPVDRLWVQETYRQAYPKTKYSHGVVYRADAARALGMDEYSDRHKWTPSTQMPRWASRITLEITGVRVERLQDISEEDALAEGVSFSDPVKPSRAERMGRDAYRTLWESINGTGSWDANPWVWVIEFKKIHGGE